MHDDGDRDGEHEEDNGSEGDVENEEQGTEALTDRSCEKNPRVVRLGNRDLKARQLVDLSMAWCRYISTTLTDASIEVI